MGHTKNFPLPEGTYERPEIERKFMLMFTIEPPMLFLLSCELGSLHEVKSVQLAFAFTYFICSCYVYAHTVWWKIIKCFNLTGG